jgi:hypothetical protein
MSECASRPGIQALTKFPQAAVRSGPWAENMLTSFVVAGVILGIVGGIVVGASWPYTEYSTLGGATSHGNAWGLAIGGSSAGSVAPS